MIEAFLARKICSRRAYKAPSIFLPIKILLKAISGWLSPTIRSKIFFIPIISFEEIIEKNPFDGVIQKYDL